MTVTLPLSLTHSNLLIFIDHLFSYLGEFAYTAGQSRYAGTYADNLMENPLQAYQLLKRLSINWNKIEHAMAEDIWKSTVGEFVGNYGSFLPNQEDLNSAALALIRLQDTYNLTKGRTTTTTKASH